jgi:Tfp pilus assembly protein PilN
LQVDYGLIGVGVLVIGVAAIVVEGALAGLWSIRLARRAQALRERLLAEQGRLQADVERLELAFAETEALWQPYGRLLRWLRHPIVIALIQSYARRRSAAAR